MGNEKNEKPLKYFFWLDMEMTGLDEKVDSILEVAVIITDVDFNVLEQYDQVVFQPQNVLEAMNDWCKKHHGESGLTAKVKDGKPLAQVETDLLQLIQKYFSKDEKVVLCGNSVGNDQRFALKYMPEVSKRLHYRIVDVSSFKEIFKAKYGAKFKKKNTHRALEDILETIEELKSYLSMVSMPKNDEAKQK
ncbi:MAG TPA: oligoribonuclease [Deltaproteobacteria bacterium]|nr:MAG: hypothetical protein A2048_06420 [Deltaproteobacteria bacterium GWA2_45_12]HBF11892.1 oligoribonuclease [Deltaproteobacteria bacterium]